MGIYRDLSTIEKGVIDNHELRPEKIKEVISGCVSLDNSHTLIPAISLFLVMQIAERGIVVCALCLHLGCCI